MENFMIDFMDVFEKDIICNLQEKKDTFIRELLIRKGRQMTAETFKENNRFSKVCVVKYCDWEYYFVDNGTKQGDFIVAIGPWKANTIFDFSKDVRSTGSCTTTCYFEWQDNNFDPVRIR